jgi:hypothetical protein
MKSIKKSLLVLGVLMLAATAAWAVDYSKMSNDELSASRGQMYNATQEEWNAFHTEWWKRLSQMSPEERQKYMGPGMGRGMGHGMGKGMGMGRGMGCRPCCAGSNTPSNPPAQQ